MVELLLQPGSMGGIWTRVREGWSWPTTPSGGWEGEEGAGSSSRKIARLTQVFVL